MSFFNLFGGGGTNALVQEYLDKGAVVIDVRTPWEFEEGHAPDSLLMPLQSIPDNVEHLKSMEKPIILVCRTGARASSAMAFLQRFGIDVINAGPWQSVV